MTATPSLARRSIGLARRALNPAGKLPRRGYAHCFIEDEGVHSRLHLHNFYSLFLPDIRDPVDVHVRVYGADGRVLGTVDRRLSPFTSLTLPMADVLAELHASAPLGTVAVDVEPGSAYAKRLVEVGPQNATAQSPFWMGFYDDGGSVAYVHSIDQYYGAVFGMGKVAGFAYRARWHRGGDWSSKRLIDAEGLTRADAYLVNHSPARGEAMLRWMAHPGGETIAERSVSIAPHGAARVSVTAEDVARAGAGAGKLRLVVDGLLTDNGKPYVMVRYGEGPFSLHHG
jgi:hypothetical protein